MCCLPKHKNFIETLICFVAFFPAKHRKKKKHDFIIIIISGDTEMEL